ncbi:MAG TPA: hypothetical protein VFQ60_04270 [Patescibacteria group bacterium]|nr:hypothetical protein [Patescibacteria group bacterium]
MFGNTHYPRWIWISAVILIALAIILGCFIFLSNGKRAGTYAVFLTNGQVYFGSIASTRSQTLLLKDIYYIQPKDETQKPGGDVTLAKFGNEFHGPEDWMEISRSQIVMIEKLREDSKLLQAIRSYGKK